MPRIARWPGRSAAVIAACVALLGVAIVPSEARAYCNQSHQSWDPCYEGKSLKPPQETTGDPLAHAGCGDLLLQVAASVGQATCRAANISDADARGRAETISAKGPGTFFFAEYLQAGIHTYISRLQPSDVDDDTDLATSDWEPQVEIQGFDVRRFRAEVGGTPLHCGAFTKHWGHMTHTTGYRHRITGLYCSIDDHDVGDGRLNQLLASIEPSE